MRATGAQGRGVIKHLVSSDWHVHALVSDALSERALALRSFGTNVTLFQGDWTEPNSMMNAMKYCQALVLIQMPSFTDDSELQEARKVLDIAKAAGVKHVVFSSTQALNNPNIREELRESAVAPALLNKSDVEEIVQASGLTWTIFRPGYFLTNLLPPLVYWMYPEFKDRKFVNAYGPDCRLTLVDPDDIGAFIVAAFENPVKFDGQTVTIVGEIMSVEDVLKELNRVSHKPIEAVYLTPDEVEKAKSNPFIAGHKLCIGLDEFVDMEEIKSWSIPLTSVKAFLEKHKSEIAS